MNERPWLILTLRRTGGTSLTAFLSRVSSFSTIQHEPFNRDRVFGRISREFMKNGNVRKLEEEVAKGIASRPNIKHCMEIVPVEVTRALVDACLAAGYHFILLTRRQEERRIASLLLAQSTGAWGPEEAASIYPRILSGEVKPPAITLDRVREVVRVDRYSLGCVLSLLRNRNIVYRWLLFEELYFGETRVEDQAIAIAAELGIEIAPEDPKLAEFSSQEGQSSADIAKFVPNYEEAANLLARLCVP